MLTIRDSDLIILEKLNDRDLFNFCLSNKSSRKLCSYEPFWMNRLMEKYPDAKKYFQDYSIFTGTLGLFYPEIMKYYIRADTWRRYYLQTVYYVNKMKEEYNFDYKTGNPINYYVILFGFKYPFLKIENAAKFGYIDLIEHLIKTDNRIYSNPAKTYLFSGAAQGNQIDVIKHFWKDPMPIISANSGLIGAVRGENMDLIKFFINKGANNIQDAIKISLNKQITSELEKYL